MDRSSPPVGRSIGPALRELLDASPKAVRRAVEDRRGAEDLGGGKRAKKEETRRLVSSLDAVARFLTEFSALHPGSSDPATAHPVLDPLLERIVRPTAGRGPGTKEQTSRSTSSADEKKTALRLVAWLVSSAEALGGGEKENDAIRRANDVGDALVKRCAPPTPRRTRLAACLALKHAAVNAPLQEAFTTRAFTTDAAEALLLTIAESERARDEADPPTRLAVAAVDAALAVTARAAIAATEGEVVEFAAHANAARETCAVVRGWWRAGSPARAPAVALDEVVRAFDTVARWSARAALEKDDTGEAERYRWLARAWRHWAPLVAAEGFFSFPEPVPSAAQERARANQTGSDLDLAPGAVRLARWLATAASAAADDAAGVSGAGDRLRHALVATSLAVGQLGLADGADVVSSASPEETEEDDSETTGTTKTERGSERGKRNDAASVFRARAAETLVPALRSRVAANAALGAALLRAALVPRSSRAGWGPEQSALLDGLLPLLEEAPEVMTPGLASLAAALVATQPSGAARRNAVVVLGESALFSRADAHRRGAGSERRDDDVSFADALETLAGRISESSEKDASVRDAARDAIRRAPLSRTVATVSALFSRGDSDAAKTKRRAEIKEYLRDDALEAVLLAALRGRGAVVATRALLEALRDERFYRVLFAREENASSMGPGVARAIETFAAWFRETASRAHDTHSNEKASFPTPGFDAASLLETARVVVDAALSRGEFSKDVGVASATATARVVAELAPWIGAPPVSRVAFQAARDALREKPFSFSSASVTDERPVEDEETRDPVAVAFARLAPLLLLRAMQVDAWDDWAEARAAAADDDASLADALLALARASSNAPDDARRLAAELHGRVVPGFVFDQTSQNTSTESGAAAARVAAMESALDAFRLRDARALALASLSGLASRGVAALGSETTPFSFSTDDIARVGLETDVSFSVRDRHRVAFLRLATFGSERFRTNGPAAVSSEDDVEVAKTRAGGAETLARVIAAELAAPRAAPAGGLGAGLGDGGRASATLEGIVAAIVGDPRAPPWASLERSKSVASDDEETSAKDAAARRVASRADVDARRVALAESLTGSVRVIMNVPDRAVAEAFARATYPRLAAHAETEATLNVGGVAAARFSLCAVAFTAAATDATARSVRASLDDDTNASRENDARLASRRRFHKLAVMKYAKDLARAASAALRDGATAPEARVAAAGLATAMLAADDDALEAIARSGALDDLRAALEVAARAEDVPPLANAARGLLKAMGA